MHAMITLLLARNRYHAEVACGKNGHGSGLLFLPSSITTAMMETIDNNILLYPICDRCDCPQEEQDQKIVDTQPKMMMT